MKKDRRIKNISGLNQIMIDIKPDRCDSDVYINSDVDVTNLVKYMKNLKVDNKDITYFHAFITALAKTIYNRPKLNYYVRNRHLYEHKDIVISFVAKISFDDKSEEIMLLIPIDEKDNIFSISKKIKDKVDYIRSKKEDNMSKKGANSAIDIVGKLPNILRVPIVGVLKTCDKFGILPSTLVKDNLYYSSIIVSNLGSIKCGAIYHHITNFGACSGLITFGEIMLKEIIDKNGNKNIRNVCEIGVNLDERIADGYYFAKSLKLLEYVLDNPKLLEEEVCNKIEVSETH